MSYTINIHGHLLDLGKPQVMGILNVTPDSFFAASRQQTAADVAAQANRIVAEGAAIIDVGACSTRPGSEPVSEAEEMERLSMALDVVCREQPGSVVSVDTFRPAVARMAVEKFGAAIINDVQPSDDMFRMVARLGVPYILTSHAATMEDMLMGFATQVQQLRNLGQKDIILDPGFGFGKTMEDNYRILNQLERLRVMELPILAGLSRKSMMTRLLGITADEALNATTALNTIALMKGAAILRVHDVAQAVQCVSLLNALQSH